jgi:hypothetical protein
MCNEVKQHNQGGCSVGINNNDYEVNCSDGLKWHDIRTKFHEDLFGHSGSINVITWTM